MGEETYTWFKFKRKKWKLTVSAANQVWNSLNFSFCSRKTLCPNHILQMLRSKTMGPLKQMWFPRTKVDIKFHFAQVTSKHFLQISTYIHAHFLWFSSWCTKSYIFHRFCRYVTQNYITTSCEDPILCCAILILQDTYICN